MRGECFEFQTSKFELGPALGTMKSEIEIIDSNNLKHTDFKLLIQII